MPNSSQFTCTYLPLKRHACAFGSASGGTAAPACSGTLLTDFVHRHRRGFAASAPCVWEPSLEWVPELTGAETPGQGAAGAAEPRRSSARETSVAKASGRPGPKRLSPVGASPGPGHALIVSVEQNVFLRARSQGPRSRSDSAILTAVQLQSHSLFSLLSAPFFSYTLNP